MTRISNNSIRDSDRSEGDDHVWLTESFSSVHSQQLQMCSVGGQVVISILYRAPFLSLIICLSFFVSPSIHLPKHQEQPLPVCTLSTTSHHARDKCCAFEGGEDFALGAGGVLRELGFWLFVVLKLCFGDEVSCVYTLSSLKEVIYLHHKTLCLSNNMRTPGNQKFEDIEYQYTYSISKLKR